MSARHPRALSPTKEARSSVQLGCFASTETVGLLALNFVGLVQYATICLKMSAKNCCVRLLFQDCVAGVCVCDLCFILFTGVCLCVIISHQAPIYLSELHLLHSLPAAPLFYRHPSVQNTIVPNKVLWSALFLLPGSSYLEPTPCFCPPFYLCQLF